MSRGSGLSTWNFGSKVLLIVAVDLMLVVLGKGLVKFTGMNDGLTIVAVQFLSVLIAVWILYRK